MAGMWAGADWAISVESSSIAVESRTCNLRVSAADADTLQAQRGLLRWHLRVDGRRRVRLRGMKRGAAAQLRTALQRAALNDRITAAVAWERQMHSVLTTAVDQQRWVAREQVDALVAARPDPGLIKEVADRGVAPLLAPDEVAAVASLNRDVASEFAQLNESILAAELRNRRAFFDRIEKSPLTDEQARAVVCMDNRVHLLAAAGSGKTSVMVARAAYAVDRGFVRPDKILLLAFNKAAASELQERITDRFEAAGIPSTGVKAATFHSFGLEVIGRATGHKPRLASWLDAGEDARMMERIVDQLRDADPTFRYRWDLFRLLFAGAPTEPDGGTPDDYDAKTKTAGFRTLDGEAVRSAGERTIADWLFLNGVNYRYEQPYKFVVSDETHSQYRPDFYYPDADVWHEHWGLDADGKAPAEFRGYAESMAWKQRLHAQHGTRLIESTWHEVIFGDGLDRLAADLASHGIELDWNPDRRIASGVKPVAHADLARLIRTFMSHVKSNSLDEAAIQGRLVSAGRKRSGFRSKLFLDLYWPIHREWDRMLRTDNSVDFEDMLVLAAEHLEHGATDMGYDLVLVDEFQDASQARARLVRGLLQRPNRFLLAVGDDWQAINRFAGADVSVMMNFEEWFGKGPQLALTTTFRCPQTICDVASTFVTRNPRQFNKTVRSAQLDPGPPVTLIRATDVKSGVSDYLEQLSARLAAGIISPSRDGTVTVDVLGRYRFDADTIPRQVPSNLVVTFRTAHGSKGLEADYIVLPRVVSGRYGFPSEIADDPVLNLAMASLDDFPNSEDRRLFYVALTRARRQVTLVTQIGHESPFVVELLKDQLLVAVDGMGETEPEVLVCPRCNEGTLVRRNGRFGEFLGCSRFPACTGKAKI